MVPADRHLGSDEALDPDWARENQQKLIGIRPTFIVDGLSAYNPQLDIHKFPELAEWLTHYCDAGSPGRGIKLYKLC
jgi:glycine/serine hydroxymethyltransferase